MKFKYQSLVATALLLVAICFVLFMQKSHAFEGAYVGGSFGGLLSPVNHLGDKITDIMITGGGMKINDHWTTARKPSLNFSVNTGFGRLFDKHYCGAEFSINKSRYRMKIAKSSENWELRTEDELNLSLRDVDFALDYRHGYLISKDTMIFAKTGVSRNRARLSLNTESVVKIVDAEFKHPSYIKHEKTIHPLRIGFGIQHKIIDNLSVVCDYTYSRYLRHFKLKGNTTSTSAVGNVTAEHNHKLTIQDTSIMAGLKYHF